MKVRRALWSLAALTAIYVGAIFVVDQRRHTFDDVMTMLNGIAAVAVFAFVSYVLRYLRWRWLLRRRGHVSPWLQGFASYVAGFAFTATPGKVGELIRIRHFARMGTPGDRVFSTFIVERLIDLLTLGLMSAPLAATAAGYGAGLALIAVAFIGVVALSRYSGLLYYVVRWLRRRGWSAVARSARSLACGLREAQSLLKPTEIVVSLLLGLAAWSVVSLGFVVLLRATGHALPWMQCLAIPPAGMLIGAASMLPGGVGATETSIALLLQQSGLPINVAAAVAIAFRIGTLWFAIVVGLLATLALEVVAAARPTSDAVASAP